MKGDYLRHIMSAYIRWPGGEFLWDWRDWLGLVLVLLAIAILLTVLVALWRGESPLKVLDRVGRLFVTVTKRPKSN